MRYPTMLAIVRASWEARMDRQQRKPRVRAAEFLALSYGPRAQVSHPVVRRSFLASAGDCEMVLHQPPPASTPPCMVD